MRPCFPFERTKSAAYYVLSGAPVGVIRDFVPPEALEDVHDGIIIEFTGWTFAEVAALSEQQREKMLGFISGRNMALSKGEE
jgi:hypothetical protein